MKSQPRGLDLRSGAVYGVRRKHCSRRGTGIKDDRPESSPESRRRWPASGRRWRPVSGAAATSGRGRRGEAAAAGDGARGGRRWRPPARVRKGGAAPLRIWPGEAATGAGRGPRARRRWRCGPCHVARGEWWSGGADNVRRGRTRPARRGGRWICFF